jgi:hypothetical protein
VQQVHFCSGSVFVTGDAIAMSLLRYVQAVATARRSDVVSVPALTATGAPTSVTLMVNGVSQISADALHTAGAELEDDAFVARMEALAHELLTPTVWGGDDSESAA